MIDGLTRKREEEREIGSSFSGHWNQKEAHMNVRSYSLVINTRY